MKTHKLSIVILLSLAILSTQGCSFPKGYPLEEIQNILIAGIDIDGQDVLLTIVVDSLRQGSKPGEEQIGTKVYTATGKTVSEAKRKLHTYTDKRLSWFHLKYVILGHPVAQQGTLRFLNYLCENNENSFSHNLIVAKNMTAQAFIQKTNTEEAYLADNLDALFEETKRTGKSSDVQLLDYAIIQESAWGDLYIPTVQLYANPIAENNEKAQKQSPLFILDGYALFKDDKLIAYIDGGLARGLSFLLDEVSSTHITIKDTNNQYVSFEVIDSKTNILANFVDPFSATIEVDVKTNLLEYQESENITKNNYITDLEQRHSALIQNEIEQTLSLLQSKNIDVIGIGDIFYHENPIKWQNVKAKWYDVFPKIMLTVKVNSYILGSYNLINAIGD